MEGKPVSRDPDRVRVRDDLEFLWLMERTENGYACAAHNDDSLQREFIQSWDQVQQFYRSFDNSWWMKGIVLLFIAALRRAGYDRKLRAGNSLYSLILSRSRLHGLRAEQPFVAFEFRAVTMDLRFRERQAETVSRVPIALFGPVKKALAKLSARPLS
jgi:hypothetical protein